MKGRNHGRVNNRPYRGGELWSREALPAMAYWGDREGLGACSQAQLHREASQLAEAGKLPSGKKDILA